MQFAFGGSASAGNADALGNELGLTGIPFINVANGCATGGSSLMAAYAAIKSGEHDIGLVAGFDKHDRGAFNADPAALGIGQWYGEVGLMMTTQFFAMKIQKYMHDYGISARGAGGGFHDAQRPTHQVHVLLPGGGRGGTGIVPGGQGEKLL
jgi:acetyl-CoA acetyltransferase